MSRLRIDGGSIQIGETPWEGVRWCEDWGFKPVHTRFYQVAGSSIPIPPRLYPDLMPKYAHIFNGRGDVLVRPETARVLWDEGYILPVPIEIDGTEMGAWVLAQPMEFVLDLISRLVSMSNERTALPEEKKSHL